MTPIPAQTIPAVLPVVSLPRIPPVVMTGMLVPRTMSARMARAQERRSHVMTVSCARQIAVIRHQDARTRQTPSLVMTVMSARSAIRVGRVHVSQAQALWFVRMATPARRLAATPSQVVLLARTPSHVTTKMPAPRSMRAVRGRVWGR